MKLYDYEKKHLRQMRRDAAGCTLFLKRNKDFPLEAPCEIALYGNGARCTLKGGTGSGNVNSRFYVTAEKGLEKAGFTITNPEWMDAYDEVRKTERERFVKQIKQEAAGSGMSVSMYSMGKVDPEPEYDIPVGSGDVAIYVLSRTCGEGNDRRPVRGDILLTKTEISDILQIRANYNKFMLVLNVGAPIDLSPIADAVDNILLLSQIGAVTGVVLADILLGRADPSGKLTASWIAWKDHEQIGDFGDLNDTHYEEGVYVGYRYYETAGVKPLFPFGYGKSYTDFTVTPEDALLSGKILTVNARVKNTGDHAGREAVLAYVSVPDNKFDEPARVLGGFTKSETIDAGSERSVDIRIDLRDIATYDTQNGRYVLPAGDYVVSVGDSVEDTKEVCVLHAASEIVTKDVQNLLDFPDFQDYRPERSDRTYDTSLPVIELTQDDIPCVEVDYNAKEEIDPRVKEMSDEDLALLSVGAFNDDKKGFVIGDAGQRVPGSAGETCGKFADKGIRALALADGPAGLRLDRKIGVDGKGTYSYGNPMLNDFMDFLPKAAQVIPGIALRDAERRTREGGQIKYQFATAIPIGTAIAQSFDIPFAEECGDIVGSEMETFGVDVWLAPALNIQRDIRCGRNFEYYSEDPVVAGYFAAAITNGVQKHPGRYTCIKHYAANNQETNRMVNNSVVSERAMREIYLRGFEIAVRESHPGTVMSSYNLINGIHSMERRGLITDILRSEFGFRGAVMTDWVVPDMAEKDSSYHYPEPAKVAAAGNSLFMPGGRHDYEDILSGLSLGTVTREQLEINVSHLLTLSGNGNDK
ncbi:MAG: glycoside hydrolase family 3 C-terminal domain-containing protein [Lachnospiraceae bacterium]|nr:glycoside hydrolase family 3 C-terminal domain-containing protein [Lachnospiraceae bacterium]